MLKRTLSWVGLLLVGASSYPISLVIFPIPVAVCVARARWRSTAGLLLVAALSPTLSILLRVLFVSRSGASGAQALSAGALAAFAAGSALEHAIFALTGLVAGLGMARMWPYGRLVNAVTAYVFCLMGIYLVLTWQAWSGQLDLLFEDLRLAYHDHAQRTGGGSIQEQLNTLTWLQDHKGSLVFGANLAAIYAASCVFVSLTAWVLRAGFGYAERPGSFTQMRPSEWLVWLAIGAALLCFAYHRWPRPEISVIAWNSAIGLSAVYCVNGLSIFLYGVQALRPNLLIFVLITFVLINVGAVPLFMLIGLFDTWGDYRRKIDAFVAARKARDRPGGDGV